MDGSPQPTESGLQSWILDHGRGDKECMRINLASMVRLQYVVSSKPFIRKERDRESFILGSMSLSLQGVYPAACDGLSIYITAGNVHELIFG